MAERIANSRATVETEHMGSSTPPGQDTNATFHKRTKSLEESKSDRTTSNGFNEDEKGVLRAFKDGNETTENKQIQLASNAQTNDTDNLAGTIPAMKRNIIESDFEEIKEEDENKEANISKESFGKHQINPQHLVRGCNIYDCSCISYRKFPFWS